MPNPTIGISAHIGEVVQSRIYANFSLETLTLSPTFSNIGPTIRELPRSVNQMKRPLSHMAVSHLGLVLSPLVTTLVNARPPPERVMSSVNPPTTMSISIDCALVESETLGKIQSCNIVIPL